MQANLTPLIDGDILRYEIGFGAETGWKAMTNDPNSLPPFWYVEEMLHMRINNIRALLNTDKEPQLFITEGRTFREDIAKLKPYKGTRKEHKPWHFRNLTAYMKAAMNTNVVTGIEADDLMAIIHTNDPDTIICSRDKDLKQVPGWFYSWELGVQPAFGPLIITKEGTLDLNREKKPAKLTGTGDLFFWSQVLTGDVVDNIPGLPGCGAVAAFELLSNTDDKRSVRERVYSVYEEHYGGGWEEKLLEQAQLCWIVRKMNGEKPEVWRNDLQ